MKLLLVWLFSPLFVFHNDTPVELLSFHNNKQIPDIIVPQALLALSHYPMLMDTDIRFCFTDKLKGPVMAARPVLTALLRNKKHRAYKILINPMFKLKHLETPIDHIPDSVMIGWIGHELGHIMDYETKNSWQMIGFGFRYWTSSRFIREAERIADTYATEHGLGDYILEHKAFVLGHADLPEHYKARIARLYLSPDDIVELITQMEEEDPEEQEDTLEEVEECEANAS